VAYRYKHGCTAASDTGSNHIRSHFFQFLSFCDLFWVSYRGNKRQAMHCDWLAVVNIMAAEWTDASCVDYTNYTSPFYVTRMLGNKYWPTIVGQHLLVLCLQLNRLMLLFCRRMEDNSCVMKYTEIVPRDDFCNCSDVTDIKQEPVSVKVSTACWFFLLNSHVYLCGITK